jgi:hypothetical protein
MISQNRDTGFLQQARPQETHYGWVTGDQQDSPQDKVTTGSQPPSVVVSALIA